MERRVADAEARAQALLPLPEQFASSFDSPVNEDEMRPFLNRILGGHEKYEIQCHGQICQVTSSAEDWVHALQTDENPDWIGTVKTMTFTADEESTTGYLLLEAPDQIASKRLMHRVFAAAYTGEGAAALARCMQGSARTLTVMVRFDSTGRRLVVDVPSPPNESSACVHRVVEDLVSRIPVPAGIASMDPVQLSIAAP